MTTIHRRPSLSRGETDIGWLKSRHTFSFGEYWDPQWKGFGKLRVINDDWVAPQKGFDTHGHKDMEIISIVLSGSLAHKDSLGSEAILPAGAIQVMSAGSGIRHSEYNPSATEPVHFLQIWIEPRQRGTPPSYKDVMLAESRDKAEVVLIGSDGAGQIGQDATVTILNLTGSFGTIKKEIGKGRGHWIHVIEGTLSVAQEKLEGGDGVGITSGQYGIEGNGRALFFDVPLS